MEVGFLLVVAVSAAVGLLLRPRVSVSVRRAFLVCGLGALGFALAVLALTMSGLWPFGVWTAGFAAVLLFGVTALVLPFALAVSLGRT
jgi:hypothetical protein